MKMRRTLLAIVALATIATGALAAPAQAGIGEPTTTTTTIEFDQKDLTLGEVQKVVADATKEKLAAPGAVTVISDNGKGAPSSKQLESLYAGKSVDDFKHFVTTDKVTNKSSIRQITEGTPLPAAVAYQVSQKRVIVDVIIMCGDRCVIIIIVHRLP